MYTNILIPVAFDTDKDLDGAIAIARKLSDTGAGLTFMHVMEQLPVYVTEFVPANVMAETRDTARAKLTALAARVEGATVMVVDGPTGRSITNHAQEAGVDLIVIPSHSPVMADILLGSTAAWVVRHAHCAVHVIREKAPA